MGNCIYCWSGPIIFLRGRDKYPCEKRFVIERADGICVDSAEINHRSFFSAPPSLLLSLFLFLSLSLSLSLSLPLSLSPFFLNTKNQFYLSNDGGTAGWSAARMNSTLRVLPAHEFTVPIFFT